MPFHKQLTDEERFWSKVDKSGTPSPHFPETNPCWLWTGSTIRGYGQFSVGSRTDKTRKTIKAHRFAYEIVVGNIPEGHHIDHLCNNPTCVNLSHLRTVLPRENVLRNTSPIATKSRQKTCIRGHALRTASNGKRYCAICRAEASKRFRERHPEKHSNYPSQSREAAAKRQAAYRLRKKQSQE